MDINPLKKARLDLNLTQQALAKQADISVNALIKYEQGLYPEPSAKIINALFELGYDPYTGVDELVRNYSYWRYNKVLAARVTLHSHRNIIGLKPSGGVNPFVCWRVHHLHLPSRLEFCKLLVLHPAVVQKYEEGQMRDLPKSIRQTLTQVGIYADSIDYLELLGRAYYDRNYSRQSSMVASEDL